MKSLSKKPLTILLIEDNNADAYLITETLKDSSIPNVMHLAKGAEEALLSIIGKDGKPLIPKPDLVLLDLNLPVMDGFGFLVEISKHDLLKEIQVFVLSASSAAGDIAKAQSFGAHGYFTKPLDLEEFEATIRRHFNDEHI